VLDHHYDRNPAVGEVSPITKNPLHSSNVTVRASAPPNCIVMAWLGRLPMNPINETAFVELSDDTIVDNILDPENRAGLAGHRFLNLHLGAFARN
jgi:hypothetical protein